MRTNRTRRTLWLAISLIAVLAAMLALTSVAFAGAGTDNGDTVCVDGYVINHQEKPVDGTEFEPQMEIRAVDATGATVATATVDEDGYFKFEDLPEGEYDFQLDLPYEWAGIVPLAERSTDVAPTTAYTGLTEFKARDDGKCDRIVFKIKRLIRIPVVKWEELIDGAVQYGNDWEITFEPQGDLFVKKQTKKTGEDGQDGMVDFFVTPGKWKVSEKVKSGWTPVTPSTVYLHLDQYDHYGTNDFVVFKNRQPACTGKIIVEKIGYGTQWVEDGDGWVEEEIRLGPLANWQITLSRLDGKMKPVTKYTDASGTVTFDKLHPGVYQVKEVVQKGWEAMDDNPMTVVLTVGDHGMCNTETVTINNKELIGKLEIHGHKLFKAWEPPYNKGAMVGLSGWVISATLKGTDNTITTTTNALGEFWFMEDELKDAEVGFPGATIEVCEETRDNWIPYTAKCQTVMFPYPVPPDYEGAYVKFINYQDPPLPGATSAAASYSTSTCSMTHVVQRGENLSSIAAMYGTSYVAIAQASGITNPNYVMAGSTLCIP